MQSQELKDLLISSLDVDSDSSQMSSLLEEAGVSYDFKPGFREKVLNRLLSGEQEAIIENDFLKNLNLAFYRIAFTGVAAIILLMISIFYMEGSLSLNTFLGMSDSFDESIICLLTGK